MMKENLLLSMSMPVKDIVDRTNWALKKSVELQKKYSGTNMFFNLNNVRVYNGWYGVHPIESVISIEEYYDHLAVKGMYHTTSRAVSYTPTCPGDEGWRIEEGDFADVSQVSVPKYLFDLLIDEIEIKMEDEYKQEFLKEYEEELEYQNRQIEEAQEIIRAANTMKEKLIKE